MVAEKFLLFVHKSICVLSGCINFELGIRNPFHSIEQEFRRGRKAQEALWFCFGGVPEVVLQNEDLAKGSTEYLCNETHVFV